MHDNLRNLGLDVLEVVNLRSMFDVHRPAEGSIEAPLTVLAELQQKGLVRHIGLSNVTPAQIEEGRRICPDRLRAEPLQSRAPGRRCPDRRPGPPGHRVCAVLSARRLHPAAVRHPELDVAARLGATPMQVALAWLLQRSPNILLIPGTSSIAHLRENLSAGALTLSGNDLKELDEIGS